MNHIYYGISDGKRDMIDGARRCLGAPPPLFRVYGLPSKEKSRIISPRRYHAVSGAAAAGFPGNRQNRRGGIEAINREGGARVNYSPATSEHDAIINSDRARATA